MDLNTGAGYRSDKPCVHRISCLVNLQKQDLCSSILYQGKPGTGVDAVAVQNMHRNSISFRIQVLGFTVLSWSTTANNH